MIRPWQDREAEAAAVRLHRWATALLSFLTALIILAGIGGIVLTSIGVTNSDGYQIAVGIGSLVGSVLSALPIIVLGLWAQAYAYDLRARMTEVEDVETDEDEPRPTPGRRPQADRV